MELNTAFGIAIFIFAQIGVCFNLAVMVLSSKTIAFRNPFGLLVRNEAFGAMMFSVVFGFYVAPTIMLDLKQWKPHKVSARLGHVAVLCHDIGLFSHFCVSINRFIAAYFPSRYSPIFTYRRTRRIVVLINILAFMLTFVHFFEPCWLFFDFEHVNFNYDYTKECSRVLALNIQFPRYVVINILCTLIDMSTFVKIRIINRKHSSLTGLAHVEHMRRQRMEINLISQVTVQAFVGITEIFTYFIVAPYFSNPIILFILTTFAWQMINTVDGVVVFIFNRDLRRILKRYIMQGRARTSSAIGATTAHKHSSHIRIELFLNSLTDTAV